jgi:hypothetical protein
MDLWIIGAASALAGIFVYLFVGYLICSTRRYIGITIMSFLFSDTEFDRMKKKDKRKMIFLKCVLRAPTEELLLLVPKNKKKEKRVVAHHH